ncbi:MAG: hypothetical protein NC827_03870 [Candidatus Omnitrophica bacterium]|nr:hypothetical protein [Candidatus Omnitrophota bacterium]MCM8802431.1 hypothetical protein [Candidatus Omnitrophota bacterium]
MKGKIKTSPSLICADHTQLGNKVKELENSEVDLFHFDIMDEGFAPDITLDPVILKSLSFEMHMMVFTPERLVEKFIEAGINIIIVHYESVSFPYRIFTELKKRNLNVNVELDNGIKEETIPSLIMLGEIILLCDSKIIYLNGRIIRSGLKRLEN